MNPLATGTLFDGPLDIVGDIHGELDALRDLLRHLGYAASGEHPQGRRLVFVGDLCDRGPDSPGVIALVRQLVTQGHAQCVLGNHEINLLRQAPKNGNGWFFDHDHDRARGFFTHSTPVAPAARQDILDFLATLPLSLKRSDLRVVHAAWSAASLAELASSEVNSVTSLYQRYETRTESQVRASGLKQRVHAELQAYGERLIHPHATVPLLPALGDYDELYQMSNPVRVVTSGMEARCDAPYYVGGKWRMVQRVRWWDTYLESTPVIMGHYWRCYDLATRALMNRGKQDLFAHHGPTEWLGPKHNVFCVDYSVGGRYKERELGHPPPWGTRLAALRWPECTLTFDEGQQVALEKPAG